MIEIYAEEYLKPYNNQAAMICKELYIYQPLQTSRSLHKVNFLQILTGLNSIFPSPRSVAILSVKISVCPSIYPKLEGEYLELYLSQGYYYQVKCTHPRP